MRLTTDEYFLQLLQLLARRATCVRRQVSAIIVDEHNVVLSTGYNGVPRGFPHCTDTPCAGANDPKGDTSRCMAVHAEVNAIINCARLDLVRTMYVSASPCFGCAKVIANTPIKRIVTLEPYADQHNVLQTAGIELIYKQF